MGDDETLYDRLGGQEGIDAVVDEFYDRVLADQQLEPYFTDVDTDALREHQKRFISHATGGPIEYEGKDMRAAYADLDITAEDFGRVAEHLDASLRAFDVPEAERDELLAAVADLEPDVVTA